MRTLKIIAVVLSSAFILNCGLDTSSPDPKTSIEEQNILIPCENRDGQACSVKGPAGQCDNGTEEPGLCFCAQHGGNLPFILVCG
jgi:hypothetical protein